MGDLYTSSLIALGLILFFITEDFLWFLFNPAFGFRKFRRQYIWWHEPAWWWIASRDDWVYLAAGMTFYIWGLYLH